MTNQDKIKVLTILKRWILSQATNDYNYTFENKYNMPVNRAIMAIDDSLNFLNSGIDIPNRWKAILNQLTNAYRNERWNNK